MTKRPPESVLDTGALLAFFLVEEGGVEPVERALGRRAAIGSLNWIESLSKVAELGGDPRTVRVELVERGVTGDSLRVVELTERARVAAACLRPLTLELGLSLGDRACLALARSLDVPVLTTDSRMTWWDLGVAVVHVRPKARQAPPARLAGRKIPASDWF